MKPKDDMKIGLHIAEAVLSECRKVLKQGYEDAGISGLCDEGRWEAALGTLDTIRLAELVKASLEE